MVELLSKTLSSKLWQSIRIFFGLLIVALSMYVAATETFVSDETVA